ncbi:MAG: ArnT family glycosyltransferase [Patescibacteria group bacterium]|jgi:4-amino-4-deoxy-L-arabinose transferase-like glycosyltransferase
MTIKRSLVITLLFITAFIPRLYKINNPIADWHSWRQADTAAVTRNFIKEGLTPLYPKFDSYYSLNEVGKPNPNRYFFAEFPLYNLVTYPFYKYLGVNEMYARLVSVFFSSLTAVFIYLLARRFSSERAAVLAGLVFAVLPFSIYYGRVIMPDPLHIFLSVLALYLVSLWTSKNTYFMTALAGLATTGALLTKPYALVLGLPIIYLLLRKWGMKLFKKPEFYLYISLSLLPFLFWRWHISNYPEGMFGTSWLFNQGNIRFKGSFFRWIIFDRMNRLIFATGGFVLFWLGIIRGRTKKEGWFYYLWLLAVAIFITVIAKGNVTHDYYQMPLLPIGAIFIAKGFEFLMMYGSGIKQRLINFSLALFLFAIMLAFGWYETRGFFNVNHPEIVEAGKAVDRLLPPDAKVIAPYMTDSAFLYQTNRYGWTLGGGLIPRFIEEGATHLVSTNFDDDTNFWMERCEVIVKTDSWVIINVQNCKNETEPEKTLAPEEFYM